MSDKETVILEIQYKDGERVSRKIQANTEDLKKQEKAAEKSAKSFDKLGVAALAAAAVIVGYSKKSLDLFIVQEQASAQLEGSLRAIGMYTPQLQRRYENLASSLQLVSRHGDEALLPMFSKLISIGGVTENQMERVTRAAMDFAVVSGGMETAIDLLAKASAGNTAMLGRYGIIIDETIPRAEKFGVVLKQIDERFGGMEERMALATTGGAIQQMKNEIGDLSEEFGGVLAPNINLATREMTNFLREIKTGASGPPGLIEGILTLGLSPLVYALGTLYANLAVPDVARGNGNPLAPDQINRTGAVSLFGQTIGEVRGSGGDGATAPRFPSDFMGAGGGAGMRGFPKGQSPLSGPELMLQMPVLVRLTEEAFAAAEGGITGSLQREAAEIDALNTRMEKTQAIAGVVGGAINNAFASMASGSQSAGDAIMGSMLGALGQIVTQWGTAHMLLGTANLFVPGMQAHGAGEIAAGAALLALGGTLQGLAGRGGGRGGGVGGYGGGGTPYAGSSRSSGGGGVNVFIVAADGRVVSGGKDVAKAGRAAGIEGTQMRTLLAQLNHLDRTGSPPWKR